MAVQNIKRQFIKNVGSGWFAIAVSSISGFILLPMNMQFLGKELYGISMLATALLQILTFLNAGLGPTLVRFFSKAIAKNDPKEFQTLASTSQFLLGGLGGVGGALLILCFPLFLMNYRDIPEEYYLSLFVLFLALAAQLWESFYLLPFTAILYGSNRYDAANYIRSVSKILMILLLYLGYLVSPTLYTMAFVLLFEITFRLAGNFYLAYQLQGSAIFFRRKSIDLRILPELFSFSVLALINGVFFGWSLQIPILIIGKTLGNEMVANFGPALVLATSFASLLGTISSPVTPLAAKDRLNGGNNLGRWSIMLSQIVACVGFGVVLSFALFGRELVGIWAGSEFAWTQWIVLAMITGIVLAAIQAVNYSLTVGAGNLGPFAISSVVMALLTTAGTYAGTAYWGWSLFGVALCIAVVRVLRNVGYLAFIYSRQFHYNYLQYLWLAYLKPAILVGMMILILLPLKSKWLAMNNDVESVVQEWLFLLGLGPVLLIYAVLCWFFLLNQSVKQWALGKFKKIVKRGRGMAKKG